jgi:hypothetical protein
MDVESLAKQLILQNMTPEQQTAVLDSIRASVSQAKDVQKQRIGENVRMVVEALKKIEADIKTRYDETGKAIEKRVASIKDGKDGRNGVDGKAGKDGRPGADGATGPRGADGLNGKDGRDGIDGVSVTDAHIDFDGSLIISLSSGRVINVGEVVAPDLAEKIKVITNGGGTSQVVIDTLASLQTQIDNLIPSQTGNAGKFLTTDGTVLSWDNAVGGLAYQGTWNASTNTPALTSSVGTNGYYYVVNVAGSTNLDGITDWVIGDWAIFNGSTWQKIDQTNLVTSVAGRTGAVVLANTDISGLGTMSTQNATSVAITGGTESGVTHSGDTIGTYLDYTSTSAPSYLEGRTWYDSTAKALAYYNDVSGVQVHIGHDLQFKVINNTGSTIPNGSPVYITGTSSGQTYPNVALAKADVAATATVIGLTDGSIANGAFGYVTSIGNIDNVNTGSFTVGQVLYLSPYSAGQLMNTIPPTGITVQVGMVTFVNSSTGKIYVKQTTPLNVPASIISGTVAIANGGTGVTTSTGSGSVVLSTSPSLVTPILGTPTSGNFSSGTFTWPTFNQSTTGNAATATTATNVSGGTASVTTLTTSSTVTFNGGTANGVAYLNGSKVVTSGSALTFDGTNLGVGITPTAKLDVSASSGTLMRVEMSGVAQLNIGNGGSSINYYDANTQIFRLGNGSEQMRLTSTGLGIGTSSPAAKLEVSGSTFANDVGGSTGLLRITSSNNTANNVLASFASTSTANNQLNVISATTNVIGLQAHLWSTGANSDLAIQPNGGNVGIGTSSPSSILHLSSTLPILTFTDTNDSSTSRIYQDNEAFVIDVDNANAKASSSLQFRIDNSERARIDSSGNLLVGATSTVNENNSGIKLAPAGQMSIRNTSGSNLDLYKSTTGTSVNFVYSTAGIVVGTIAINSTTVSYNTSSDYRLKNITGPITTSGAYIDSLNPVEGTWKADGSTFVGLIAHEVQEASRTLVATGTKDGEQMQGMDYSNSEIIANLIAEIQSLRQRLAAAGIA